MGQQKIDIDNTLHAKLKYMKSVKLRRVNNWGIIMHLTEFLKDIDFLFDIEWHQNPYLKPIFTHKILREREIWSTFDSCVDASLHYPDKIRITIWDGDNFSGVRTYKRFTANIIFPKKHINFFLDEYKNNISASFRKLAIAKYEEEENEKYEKAIDNWEDKLLE